MSFASLGGDLLGTGRATPRLTGELDGGHVLVPLLSPGQDGVGDQIGVAAAVARTRDADLSVVAPIATGDGTAGDGTADGALDQHLASAVEVRYTRDVVGGVLEAVRRDDVDTLVLPRGRGTGGVTARIAAHAGCDTLLVTADREYHDVASLLVPVAGGPHSGVAVDAARSMAEDCDAWVDLLHVVPEDAGERRRDAARALVDHAADRVGRPGTTTTWVLEADDPARAILDQSRYYELTVLGAPTTGPLRRLLGGSTGRSVRCHARGVVVSARSGDGTTGGG